MNKRLLGFEFEEKAVEYLKENNYTIIEQNYYSSYGEIDIIALKDDCVCAVEVKYRNNPKVSIFESIPQSKINKIVKTLLFYIQQHIEYQKDYNLRVDALLIENNNGKITNTLVENIQANY